MSVNLTKKISQLLVLIMMLSLLNIWSQGPVVKASSTGASGSAAVFESGLSAQDPYAWSNVPIGGGGYVTGLVVHPAEPNLAYIRTDVGGIYRWEETGKRWKQLVGFADRSQINLYGGDSIAIDPSNPDILYAALGKYDYWTPSDIFKSTDRGESWTRTNLKADGADVPMYANGDARTAERIAVDPNDSQTVYFGSRTKGLFRSTSAAESGSWTKVDSFPAFTDSSKSGITFVAFDPSSGTRGAPSQTVYAGAYNNGVYVSRDAGATWTLIPGSPAKPIRALMDPSSGKLYVAHGTGLVRYNGTTWEDITPPADAGKTFGSITIDPTDPNIIMTARKLDAHGNPIYRSVDGGRTWQTIPFAKDIKTPWIPGWHWSSATSSLVIDPFNPHRVWMADWYYVWQTENIEAVPSTWTNYAMGLETTVNVSNLVSPPAGNTILHSGIADNGGFDHTSLTEPPRSTYFTGTSGISLMTTTGIDVQVSNPEMTVRVGTYGWNGDSRADPGNGGYSLDGGVTYTAFRTLPYKGVQGGKVAVSATNGDHIVWVPQRSDVYYSLDRGASWGKSVGAPSGLLSGNNVFGNYYQPLSSDKVNGQYFYLYDKSGKFYRSTNGGISWRQVSSLPSQGNAWHTVQAAPGVMGEVWVSLNDQGLYRSSDAGSTFSKVSNVETAFLFSFGKHAPGRLNPAVFVYGKVAGFSKEAVFRSDDMGQTWVKISLDNPFPGNDPNAMEGDRQIHGRVYIGTNGTGLLYGARTTAVEKPVYNDTEAPSIPDHLTVLNVRRTSVDVRWDAAVDSGSGIQGYRISTGGGVILGDTYGTSYSISGLTQETGYTFKVQALDYAGNLSAYSNTLEVTTEKENTAPPSVPAGLHMTDATTAFKVSLEWLDNPENDILGYNVYRSNVPDFVPDASNKIASLITSHTYADRSGIEEKKTYYYKLEAVNIAGYSSGFTDSAAAHTPADERVDVIVDNMDSGFTSDVGWRTSSYSLSRFSTNYFHDGNVAGKWAKWTPYITMPGEYNVYMLWNATGSRGYNLPLEIVYNGGKDTTKQINQNENDNMWVLIGKYDMAQGMGHSVRLTTNGTAITVADAVKFTWAATDPYGVTHANSSTETADTRVPVIQLDQTGGSVHAAVYSITGRTNEAVVLSVKNNGVPVPSPYSDNYMNRFQLNVPLSEGNNTISIEAADRAGNKSTTELALQSHLTVPVERVTLNTYGAPQVMQIGASYKLTASVLPASADNKTIRFTINDASVATVSEAVYHAEDGSSSVWLTARNAGSATLTAAGDGGGEPASFSFQVSSPTDTTDPGSEGPAIVLPSEPSVKVVAGVIRPNVTVQANGEAFIVVKAEAIREAVKQTTNGIITVDAKLPDGAVAATIDIPVQALMAPEDNKPKHVRMDAGTATVTLSTDMLKEYSQANVMQVSISKADPSQLPQETVAQLGADAVLYEFHLRIDGQPVQEFKNKNDVEVAVSYSLKQDQQPGKVVVYFIHDDGTLQIIKNSRFDKNSVVFKPKHFSLYAAAYNDVGFSDMQHVDWAVDSIEELAAKGVVEGVGEGRFAPDDAVTRAEFIAMLMRAFDRIDLDAVSTLSDVELGAWYSHAVASAQKLGIIEGREDGTFGAHDPISRQDMAVMLQRFMKQADLLQEQEPDAPEAAFTDEADIAAYAVHSVRSMGSKGIMVGFDNGRFAPLQSTTRAEAAVVIHRLYAAEE